MTGAILPEGQSGGSWNFKTLGQVKMKSQDRVGRALARAWVPLKKNMPYEIAALLLCVGEGRDTSSSSSSTCSDEVCIKCTTGL